MPQGLYCPTDSESEAAASINDSGLSMAAYEADGITRSEMEKLHDVIKPEKMSTSHSERPVGVNG